MNQLGKAFIPPSRGTGGGGGGGTCANSPQLLCLAGRTGATNNYTLSSDASGTGRGSGVPPPAPLTGGGTGIYHLGSDTGTPGVHIQRNIIGVDRLIVGPNVDPTPPFIPGGLMQFEVAINDTVGIGAQIAFWSAGTNNGPTLYGIQARGTLSAPTASQPDDLLFKFGAYGTDTGGNSIFASSEAGSMAFFMTSGAVPTSGFVPGTFALKTTDLSGTSANRIEIQDGLIMLGSDGANGVQIAKIGDLRVSRRATGSEPAADASIWLNSSTSVFEGRIGGVIVPFITSIGGASKDVQFNNGGALRGDSNFQWDTGTATLTIHGAARVSGKLTVGGTIDPTDVLFSGRTTVEEALLVVDGDLLFNTDFSRMRARSTSAWHTIAYTEDIVTTGGQLMAVINLTGQIADITTTPFPGTGAGGVYRVTVFTGTQVNDAAAGNQSSLISWTDAAGVPRTVASSPTDLSSAGSGQFNSFTFATLGSGPITWDSTNSIGYGAAQYELVITVEKLA